MATRKVIAFFLLLNLEFKLIRLSELPKYYLIPITYYDRTSLLLYKHWLPW